VDFPTSHFTSTFHQPLPRPSDFHNKQYFASDSLISKHGDMDNYPNTFRYVDVSQAWSFGIINTGGTMLSVGPAAVPYQLICH
jgi:hypothetical protein